MLNVKLAELADKFSSSMAAATEGFDEILWIDFPDYENVGDSAIWLGSREWGLKAGKGTAGILANRAVSVNSLKRYANPNTVFVFQGGGNFGGLYSDHDRARIEAATVSRESRLVQAPQSVHFSDSAVRTRLKGSLSEVADFRMLVRDHESYEEVSDWGQVTLTPDAAHFLGPLSAPPAELGYVALLRRDKESALAGARPNIPVHDWADTNVVGRRVRQLRAEISRRTNSSLWVRGINYDQVARDRLANGLEVLSRGEVVVTDRLHAMILGLHLGRRVIAIDNKIGKLSRYATAWLGGLREEELTFCGSLDEALALVDGGV